MTDKMRSADAHAEIFVTPAKNGSFAKEQTMAKIGATTEMRTKQPFDISNFEGAFRSCSKTLKSLFCVARKAGSIIGCLRSEAFIGFIPQRL